MSKARIYTRITVEKTYTGENSSCFLSVKSSETIDIRRIKAYIYLEARGRMRTQKKRLLSTVITNSKTLVKDEFYELPFSFELNNNNFESYKGKNVELSYNLEIIIDVEKKDQAKMDRSLYTKMTTLISGDKSIKDSKYFIVHHRKSEYQVVEAKSTFDLKLNLTISFIILLLFVGPYAYYIPEFSAAYIIGGIMGVTLLIILSYKYLGSSLGVVSMQTLKDENAFLCTINKTRNFKLSNQRIFYEIIESVTDDRGTTSTTSNEILYTSDVKSLPNFQTNPNIKFYFPKRKGFHAFVYHNASIVWKMNLEGRYLGILMSYTCEFKVKSK